MDKAEQIALLKKEHQAAIDNFDFDRAESICIQIKKLRSGKGFSPKEADMTEADEKFLTSRHNQEMEKTRKRVELQEKFHAMIKERQEQHTEELQHLDLQYTIAIEREVNRPIYEANLKYKQSKAFGVAHEYALAKSVYQDAQRIEREVKEKRNKNFQALYKKQKKALIKKQEEEIRLLSEKLDNALMELDVESKKKEDIIVNTARANKIRASRKAREVPVVSHTMSPKKRRSSSVSSRSSSRQSSRMSSSRQSFRL